MLCNLKSAIGNLHSIIVFPGVLGSISWPSIGGAGLRAGLNSLEAGTEARSTRTNTLRLPGGPPATPERAGSRWRVGTLILFALAPLRSGPTPLGRVPGYALARQQFLKYPGWGAGKG